MSSLTVWLHDEPVAEIAEDSRGRLRLRYRDETLAGYGVGGVCLSVALPVRGKPYDGEPVRVWVEALLPEGETRTLLESRFAVRRGDTFALLTALGRDCAGAISCLPPGDELATPVAPKRMSTRAVATAIDELPERPLGAGEDVRVSLGGLQAKLLLVRIAKGRWGRPAAGTPSTHILKPDPAAYPGLVVAEAFALTAARLAGLDAAAVELATIGGRQVLVVERFDRRPVGGALHRLHQEDGCQALGLDPVSRKYQDLSPLPSYAALAEILADHAVDPVAEWRKLGAAMTLAVAVGNTDAHARNHGFLLANGAVRLAPLYDVAPTVAFAPARRLALWVGGEAMLPPVTRDHLIAEMRSWGLGSAGAAEVVDTTCAALLDAYPAAADAVGYAGADSCHRRTAALAGARRP